MNFMHKHLHLNKTQPYSYLHFRFRLFSYHIIFKNLCFSFKTEYVLSKTCEIYTYKKKNTYIHIQMYVYRIQKINEFYFCGFEVLVFSFVLFQQILRLDLLQVMLVWGGICLNLM